MYLAVTKPELEIPRPNVSSNESVLLAATNTRSNISSIEAVVPGPTTISSATKAVGSQDFGCHMHGVFVSQAAASVGGQSSILNGGRMPVSRTLISTTACRSRLPSLIPPGSTSSVSRNISAEVKGVKYNGDVKWGPLIVF